MGRSDSKSTALEIDQGFELPFNENQSLSSMTIRARWIGGKVGILFVCAGLNLRSALDF